MFRGGAQATLPDVLSDLGEVSLDACGRILHRARRVTARDVVRHQIHTLAGLRRPRRTTQEARPHGTDQDLVHAEPRRPAEQLARRVRIELDRQVPLRGFASRAGPGAGPGKVSGERPARPRTAWPRGLRRVTAGERRRQARETDSAVASSSRF